MAYVFIKNLDSVKYNRKLFYMDSMDLADLPPINDRTSILPGSIAKPLTDFDWQWVLNSQYEWVLTRESEVMHEPLPPDPIPEEGIEYVRIIYPGNPPIGAWVPTHFAERGELVDTVNKIFDTYAGTVAYSTYGIDFPFQAASIFEAEISIPRSALHNLAPVRQDITQLPVTPGTTEVIGEVPAPAQETVTPTVNQTRDINEVLVRIPVYDDSHVATQQTRLIGIMSVDHYVESTDSVVGQIIQVAPVEFQWYQVYVTGQVVIDINGDYKIYKALQNYMGADSYEQGAADLYDLTKWKPLGYESGLAAEIGFNVDLATTTDISGDSSYTYGIDEIWVYDAVPGTSAAAERRVIRPEELGNITQVQLLKPKYESYSTVLNEATTYVPVAVGFIKQKDLVAGTLTVQWQNLGITSWDAHESYFRGEYTVNDVAAGLVDGHRILYRCLTAVPHPTSPDTEIPTTNAEYWEDIGANWKPQILAEGQRVQTLLEEFAAETTQKFAEITANIGPTYYQMFLNTGFQENEVNDILTIHRSDIDEIKSGTRELDWDDFIDESGTLHPIPSSLVQVYDEDLKAQQLCVVEEIDPEGVFIRLRVCGAQVSESEYTGIYYVNGTDGSDETGTGSYEKPYKTFAKVKADHGYESNVTVICSNIDGQVLDMTGLDNWAIIPLGGQSPAVSIVIDNSTVNNVFKDMTITNITNNSVELTENPTTFINTTIKESVTLNNNYVFENSHFEENVTIIRGETTMINTVIDGTITIQGSDTTTTINGGIISGDVVVNNNAHVELDDVRFDDNGAILVGNDATAGHAVINDTNGANLVVDNAGSTVLVTGSTQFVKDNDDQYAILANDGTLHIVDGECIDEEGNLAPIDIEAGVHYTLGTLRYDEANSIIDEEAIRDSYTDGLSANQVYDTQTWKTIEPANPTQKAINAAFDTVIDEIIKGKTDRGVVYSAFTPVQMWAIDENTLTLNTDNAEGYQVGQVVFINTDASHEQRYIKAWIVVTEVDADGKPTEWHLSSVGAFTEDLSGTDITTVGEFGTGLTVSFTMVEGPGTTLASIQNPIQGDRVIVLNDELNNNLTYRWGFADLNGDGVSNWIPLSPTDTPETFYSGDNFYTSIISNAEYQYVISFTQTFKDKIEPLVAGGTLGKILQAQGPDNVAAWVSTIAGPNTDYPIVYGSTIPSELLPGQIFITLVAE